MLQSWIKQFVRVSVRGKFYTIANVLGLAFGFACTILILLWSDFHMSFDDFHNDSNRIFQAYQIQSYANGHKLYTYSTPGPMASFLKEKFPEVESSARSIRGHAVMGVGDKSFREKSLGFTDSTFLDIFKVEFISGNPKECLRDINSIVLTETLANKIFGTTDVVGLPVRINSIFDFTVTAIVKDYPKNSSVNFSGLIQFNNLARFGWTGTDQWGWNSYYTFIKVVDPASMKDLEDKFNIEKRSVLSSETTTFHFQPIEKARLYDLDPKNPGLIFLIGILLSLAGFVLLIACINFINLITARSANRSKEVGIRKVVGSSRGQLITQYFLESFLTTLASLVVAILIIDFALPSFNQILGVDLHLSLNDFGIWIKILLVVLCVGFVSGIYPALILSSFQPAAVLKGALRSGAKSAGFRKIMVILQFSITIFLVVLTFFMFRQFSYIISKDTGMSRKNLITMPFRKEMEPNYKSFMDEVRNIPGVKYATASSNLPFSINSSTNSVSWAGIDTTQSYLFANMSSDEFLTDAMEIPMKEGRFYSSDFPMDSTCIVINESAAKLIDKSPILGEVITIWQQPKRVIGVMKDFHFNHFSSKIEPLFIWYSKRDLSSVIIKSDFEFSPSTIDQIRSVFTKFYPEYPFESTLLEDEYQNMFTVEKQLKTILGYFSFLAIIISCMGLLSLAAYIAEQQRKSLVIRKIHGASIERILIILLSSFTKWVFISGFIAIPLSYFALNQMFRNYAYHAEYSWWVFAGALGFALLVATVTVLYQAIKSSRVNPAEILRYE